MKVSNFLVAGIVGGIVDFLLGWLFYGGLLSAYYPSSESMDLKYIALGCLFFGFNISYIFVRWGQIRTLLLGLQAGAFIGLFLGLALSFFTMAETQNHDLEFFAVDLAVKIITAGFIGGAVGMVNGAMSKS